MRYAISIFLSLILTTSIQAVDFPGTPPGRGTSSETNGTYTLQNAVISQSWKIDNNALHAAQLTNKIDGTTYDQTGRQLFRLNTQPVVETKPAGVFVAIRLDANYVSVMASSDGATWATLATYPRVNFLGEPKLIRIGKMNLQAQAKDYTGEAGENGAGIISQIAGHDPFAFSGPANHASATEFTFPAGQTFISCQIDKGNDKAQSWGPALALVWEDGKKFLLIGVRDAKPVFNVSTVEGEKILAPDIQAYPTFDLKASDFKIVGTPHFAMIAPIPNTARVADRIAGVELSADLVSTVGIKIHWRAELRDGSNYIRQTIQLTCDSKAIPLYGFEMVDLNLPAAETIGSCPGSPVVGSNIFLGAEMPGSQNAIDADGARIGFSCKLELSKAQSYEFGSVTGVVAPGQLRRSFLYYVERQRARESSPFLHYNDWYDLGFSVSADKLMDAAHAFDRELVQKRGVVVQSYLIDDGWDNPTKGLWQENKKLFPNGFADIKTQMDAMHSHMSIWISPLGGYGGNEQRTADARKMGLIPPGAKLDFSYPTYKEWFQNRCIELMQKGGVNAFKWDKAGDGVSPHFMALLDVAKHLRTVDPHVFINVTVGTWPSPFWLNHIDSTWRNGTGDVGWAGKGDDREQWITFRDGYVHRLFVEKAPLYPLNSMMAHGIVHGRCFQGERVAKAGPDLKNEARSYFAMGTRLQELYLTPSLMSDAGWDQVAESAKWAKGNADVLVDSHWVGGDPLKLETYGYAAWSPVKGTLMIRNPDDAPKTITLDATKVFDLPTGAAQHYSLSSPYNDQRVQSLNVQAGDAKAVTLEPFEVLVFDVKPR